METTIHGGDIYRNRVKLDFSVNRNPFGIPDGVQRALHQAVEDAVSYPDIRHEALIQALARHTGVPEEYFLLGNGASELFMAIVHGVNPRHSLIPVPSFYGYEWAAQAADGKITYYEMPELCLGEAFFSVLEQTDAQLLFLANPNNPVGNLLSPEYLADLLSICKNRNITVVLDECFLEFVPHNDKYSFISRIREYPNLIVVRAFTKLYAIPGVRLGYLVCAAEEIREAVGRHLPEWNLSVFAERAGIAALQETEYVRRTVEFLEAERGFFAGELKRLGIKVYESCTDYLLMQTKQPLYDLLLREGILIRDCGNYRGLTKGYYRTAVRLREENDKLLAAVQKGVSSYGVK